MSRAERLILAICIPLTAFAVCVDIWSFIR